MWVKRDGRRGKKLESVVLYSKTVVSSKERERGRRGEGDALGRRERRPAASLSPLFLFLSKGRREVASKKKKKKSYREHIVVVILFV